MKRFLISIFFILPIFSFVLVVNTASVTLAAGLCCPKGYDENSCPFFGVDKPTQCCSHPAPFIYNILNKVSCESSATGTLCPGNSCPTALGNIKTDPTGFVQSIFGILLSLAGGVALILIMVSGYRLMVSEGNPEKVQAAREQLTSAIVGLLFVIFSITILQIIGVDILHIPGFQK